MTFLQKIYIAIAVFFDSLKYRGLSLDDHKRIARLIIRDGGADNVRWHMRVWDDNGDPDQYIEDVIDAYELVVQSAYKRIIENIEFLYDQHRHLSFSSFKLWASDNSELLLMRAGFDYKKVAVRYALSKSSEYKDYAFYRAREEKEWRQSKQA